jgi:CBS domain-containing protein
MAFVQNAMHKASQRLVTISVNATLVEAAQRLNAGADIILACSDAGILSGIITKTDIVQYFVKSESDRLPVGTSVASAMKQDVVTCRPEESLTHIWAIMHERGLKNLPILDPQGRPIGILNARDALQILLEESEDEEELLRNYVIGIGYR